MTYAEITGNSFIISVTSETLSEDELSYTVVFRILNDSKWKKMIHSILKSSHDDETFGVSVRQEFYLNEEGSPAFVWSMLVWGDLDAAVSSLTPILEKRGAPPAPPKSLAIAAPTSQPRGRQFKTKESIVTEIPLPFKRQQAEKSDTSINVRDSRVSRKPRAFVEGVKS